MKNPIILVFISMLLFTSLAAKSQEVKKDSTIKYYNSHIFTVAPFGFINKVRIRYEFANSKQTTFGVQSSIYYDKIFPGLQLVGNVRQYISERHAPFGFYVMGQAGFAFHKATAVEGITYQPSPGFLSIGGTYSHSKSYEVKSYGAIFGGALGYQTRLDRRKRIILDIYLGIRVLALNKDLNNIYVNSSAEPLSFNLFTSPYKTNYFSKDGDGVGGFVNTGINFGYRF